MPILSSEEATTAQHLLSELSQPVSLLLFLDDQNTDLSNTFTALCQQIVEMSPFLKLQIFDMQDKERIKQYNIEHQPALVIQKDIDVGVKFYGPPLGYELEILIGDIIDIGNNTNHLKPNTLTQLKNLKHPLHMQVFVTTTCPYCPNAVKLSHQFAINHADISADVIIASDFPQLAQKYNVQGVPKIVLNKRKDFVGAVPEDVLLGYVLDAGKKPKSSSSIKALFSKFRL